MYKLLFLLVLVFTVALFSCGRKKQDASLQISHRVFVGNPILVLNQ